MSAIETKGLSLPTDEDFIKEARHILARIDNRIERLSKERQNLESSIQALIQGAHTLVKICPFCGGAINPFIVKEGYYRQGLRIFHCERCNKVFSVTLRRTAKVKE